MGETCIMNGVEMRNILENLKWRIHLGNLLKDNIKMDLRETEYEGVENRMKWISEK
jgi:hypothetical protein